MESVGTAGIVALLISALLAPFIYKMLLKTNSRQKVSQHVPEHAAKQGTPTMGGFIILIGLFVGIVVDAVMRGGLTKPAISVAILTVSFGLVGYLDDYVLPKMKAESRGFNWMPKLALQIGSVLIVCFVSGMNNWMAMALAAFIVLFFSNAYNFSDGLDGLAGGIGMILAATFFLMGIDARLDSFQPYMIALLAGFVPFLFLNAPPARVFMGDVGALPIGAVFGWVTFSHLSTLMTVKARNDLNQIVDVLNPDLTKILVVFFLIVLLMLLEIVPVPLQVASAKLRKGKRLFPFRTPIHHGFQHNGWPETRVVYMFHLFQFVCSAVALYLFFFMGFGSR